MLHDFGANASDGRGPRYTRLIVQDGELYGVAQWGGTSDSGVLFKMNTDGNDYQILHDFAGGPADGRYPSGALVLSEGNLYGVTDDGGDVRGVVYRIGTDGTGYTHLHEFTGGDADGWEPVGGLILVGGALYGTTIWGGDGGGGVVYQIGTDGTGYSHLHEFAGAPEDGKNPFAWLEPGGSGLYGTTRYGGAYGGGVVFTVVPEPATLSLLLLGGAIVLGKKKE